MCFFPLPNVNVNSPSYKKGVLEYKCGACPECLRDLANPWVLRCVYEARSHKHNCMVTLTYDSYLYDSRGRVLGEKTPDPDIKVSKRHVQLFIKRLRKWYSGISDEKIKYRVAAEYGSRTHRAHYHIILFGVRFPDCVPYKKSKRGNSIFKSCILTNLWGYGICTVDSINISGAVARYCTKYTAKTRSQGTFSLSSQRIGFSELLKDFSGGPYSIDGRIYAVPRFIWQWYIQSKYSDSFPHMDYRYVNRTPDTIASGAFQRSRLRRKLYMHVRDADPVYCSYLICMRRVAEQADSIRLPVRDRIRLLPENKWHFYKVDALKALDERESGIPVPAPGSNCISAFERWKGHTLLRCPRRSHLPCSPCPNTASDTKIVQKVSGLVSVLIGRRRKRRVLLDNRNIFVFFDENSLDNPFDL